VKFLERSDGTLQFLPGRLEILSGPDLGQEVHFARPLGEETASITFGRSEGNPLRHVQLLDPTVSRSHARLDFSGGRWRLSNLSSTNPVVLNGRAVDEREVSVLLGDGDRIEMGAVVFVFRER
jgi:pSer/pThr/pTyr-binding forkhead associated (FHA) protein